MRIAYLHQHFRTPRMSGGTRSYEMARRLVDSGHEVHIVTSDSDTSTQSGGGWRKTIESGIHVHWLPVPYSNSMTYSARIRAFLEFAARASAKATSIKPDVVFATSTPLTVAIPGVITARLHRIPMVFEVRDLWPEMPIAVGALKNPLMKTAARFLERFAYRNSTHIVALSPGMRDGIMRTGVPTSKVSVIPNSCDSELFSIPREAGFRVRDRYDWLGSRPLIVYAGTLGAINGVRYLVKVAEKAALLDPDVRFLIVGEGREEESIRDEAAARDVLGKNLFMLKSLPKSEIPELLSACDISMSLFLDIPEMRANSANKFFDTLAAGRPIAINYGGWHSEMIERYGIGLNLNRKDHEVAALQLVTAARNREWLESAGNAARELGAEKFSRDELACELESILKEVIG